MRRTFRTTTALLAAILSLPACTGESEKLAYANHEANIDKFVTAALSADEGRRSVMNGGSVRVVLSEGEGPELGADGMVSLYYAGFVFTGGTSLQLSSMFATNDSALAESAGWDTSDSEAFTVKALSLGEGKLLPGLKAGLEGVRAGEECVILFSAKYGYGDRSSGTIPAMSALAYQIKVVGISEQ